jgi:NTE family protein
LPDILDSIFYKKNKYGTFIGTSTGSLRIPQLVLNKTEKFKEIFISLNQRSMFNKLPFVVKYVNGRFDISISHIIFY